MIRVAAVGDLHVTVDVATNEVLTNDAVGLEGVADDADILLLAGDLTNCGDVAEAQVLARAIEPLGLPVVAVLGNHDHHAGAPDQVASALSDVGVRVLDGEGCQLDIAGFRVGIAGAKGFAGGLAGPGVTEFGEVEMKRFVAHGRVEAERFGTALRELDASLRIGLLHYSPIGATIVGEVPEIHTFLADHRLAEQVDRYGADLVIHGHAHSGREHGTTPGGIPVRNVARPVIRAPYRVYVLDGYGPTADPRWSIPEPVAAGSGAHVPGAGSEARGSVGG